MYGGAGTQAPILGPSQGSPGNQGSDHFSASYGSSLFIEVQLIYNIVLISAV